MTLKKYIGLIALALSYLIVSLPIAFAEEYNRIYDENGNLIHDSQTDIWREYDELPISEDKAR